MWPCRLRLKFNTRRTQAESKPRILKSFASFLTWNSRERKKNMEILSQNMSDEGIILPERSKSIFLCWIKLPQIWHWYWDFIPSCGSLLRSAGGQLFVSSNTVWPGECSWSNLTFHRKMNDAAHCLKSVGKQLIKHEAHRRFSSWSDLQELPRSFHQMKHFSHDVPGGFQNEAELMLAAVDWQPPRGSHVC